MKIKAILFDIDDTLFPSGEFAISARKNAVKAMIEAGMDVEFDEAFEELMEIVGKRGSNYGNHFDLLCKKLGYGKSSKLVAAGIAAYHNKKAGIMPFPEAARTLLKLRENGFKLYVASDGKVLKQWDKLIRMKIHLLFHDVFVSEEIGCRKSVKFFKSVLKRIGLKPEECLMVGDLVERDIEPPRKIGMESIRLVRRGEKAKGKHEIKKLDELLKILEVD